MIKKNSKFGEYSILNCQEVLPWFLEKRRENQIACNFCQKAGCYVCNQSLFISENNLKKARILKHKIGRVNQFYGKFLINSINHQTVKKTYIDFGFILSEQLNLILLLKKMILKTIKLLKFCKFFTL